MSHNITISSISVVPSDSCIISGCRLYNLTSFAVYALTAVIALELFAILITASTK